MSLFAENVAGGPGNEPLLKFRAGKMFTSPVDGGPKLKVSPDKRKGTILLTKEVDGMMHFKWMDRTAGKVEDDFLIMPTDQAFSKVDTGREGDRVYLLQFENPQSRRFFFWLQEPKDEKDAENCQKMNDFMNKPEMAAAAMADLQGGGSGGEGNVQMSDLQSILQNMGFAGAAQAAAGGSGAQAAGGAAAAADGRQDGGDAEGDDGDENGMGLGDFQEDQLLQMALAASQQDAEAAGASLAAAAAASGGGDADDGVQAMDEGNNAEEDKKEEDGADAQGPPADAAATAAPGAGAASAVSMADMERAMQAILGGAGAQRQASPLNLNRVLTSDFVAPLIEMPEVRDALLPLLPEGQQTAENLREIIRSPQLAQSISALTAALQTDNFNAVVANTGLNPAHGADALARGDGVLAFLQALQGRAKEQAEQQTKGVDSTEDVTKMDDE